MKRQCSLHLHDGLNASAAQMKTAAPAVLFFVVVLHSNNFSLFTPTGTSYIVCTAFVWALRFSYLIVFVSFKRLGSRPKTLLSAWRTVEFITVILKCIRFTMQHCYQEILHPTKRAPVWDSASRSGLHDESLQLLSKFVNHWKRNMLRFHQPAWLQLSLRSAD